MHVSFLFPFLTFRVTQYKIDLFHLGLTKSKWYSQSYMNKSMYTQFESFSDWISDIFVLKMDIFFENFGIHLESFTMMPTMNTA